MHDSFGPDSHDRAPATPLTTECARRVGEELPRLVRFVRQRIDAVLPANGMTTGQYFVLALVREGVVSPGELATRFAVSSPTITGLIARLAAKGLVGRLLNDRDRRTVHLSVTEQGTAALARMEAHITERMTPLVAGLTEVQQRELIAAMDSVHALLQVADEAAARGRDTPDRASGTKTAPSG